MKHMDLIDEYFNLSDLIISDFLRKFLEQEQNPYLEKSLTLSNKQSL